MDHVLDYMEKKHIPITRENYISLNWMGDYPADQPLPGELEAELPQQLQMESPDHEEPDVKATAGLDSLSK